MAPPEFTVILFYKYASIDTRPTEPASSADDDVPQQEETPLSARSEEEEGAWAPPAVRLLARRLSRAVARLSQSGRLLVSPEGVNGTLAVRRSDDDDGECGPASLAIEREICRILRAAANREGLCSCTSGSACEFIDFKRSGADADPFVDTRVKIVRELVGWNGARPPVSVQEVELGAENVRHLDAASFHSMLKDADGKDSMVLLDIRDGHEAQLGRFKNALTSNARTMQEIGRWLEELAASETCRNKTLMMYCTGGVRCEKASLHLNRLTGGQNKIFQLSGGIARYLEAYGDSTESLFLGKNMVFDRRVFAGEGRRCDDGEGGQNLVGLCESCKTAEGKIFGCAVCAVCRMPMLMCMDCLYDAKGEIFCAHHAHLQGIYTYALIPHLPRRGLLERRARLYELIRDMDRQRVKNAQGKSTGKRKTRTLRNCISKIDAELSRRGGRGSGRDDDGDDGDDDRPGPVPVICRNSLKPIRIQRDGAEPATAPGIQSDTEGGCAEATPTCSGDCWGFFSGRPAAASAAFTNAE